MANYDQETIQFFGSQNQLMVGAKGPLCARLIMDFAQQPEYVLDMQNVQARNMFDLCQTMFRVVGNTRELRANRGVSPIAFVDLIVEPRYRTLQGIDLIDEMRSQRRLLNIVTQLFN